LYREEIMSVKINADIEPSWKKYPDIGCEISGGCLTCPAPYCPHDKNDIKMAKLLEVNRLVMQGLTSEQIARKIKKEVRYVDYWKKKYLENPTGYKL
jgi:hypothetical protein